MLSRILIGTVAAFVITGAAACTKKEETKPAAPAAAPAKPAGLFSGLLGFDSLLKYRTQFFLVPSAPTEAAAPRPEWSGSAVRSYRALGKTGWKMSDISFGTASVRDPEVVRAAVDRGINY